MRIRPLHNESHGSTLSTSLGSQKEKTNTAKTGFSSSAVPKPYREEAPVPKQPESSFLAEGAKMIFAAAVAIKVKEVGSMLILRKLVNWWDC